MSYLTTRVALGTTVACILFIIFAVLVMVTEQARVTNVGTTRACLADGSCVGGDPVFNILRSLLPIVAPNLPGSGETASSLKQVNGVGPHLDLVALSGSNILVQPNQPAQHDVRVSMTQAIVVGSLDVSGATLFGINTSCVRPLDASCYNIAGQACRAGHPLAQSCFPSNASITNVTVDGTFHCLHCNLTYAANQSFTSANYSMLHVEQSTQLSTHWNCVGAGGIGDACFDLGGLSCPDGPWNATCIPSSLVFYNMAVTNALSVDNVECLGPPIPYTCLAGAVVGGQTTGTYQTMRVHELHGTVVNASSGSLSTPSALVLRGGDWVDEQVTPSPAVATSLASRDAGGNTTFNAVHSTGALVQGPASNECLGVGVPKSLYGDSQDYYMLVSASTASESSYYALHDTIMRYNVAAQTNTLIGPLTPTVFCYMIALSPQGIIYCLNFYTGGLAMVNEVTAAITYPCPGFSMPTPNAIAFHASGLLYYFLYSPTFQLWHLDIPSCTQTLVKNLIFTSGCSGGGCTAVIFGNTMYLSPAYDGNPKLYSFDIGSTTSGVIASVDSAIPDTISIGSGLFLQCVNETAVLSYWNSEGFAYPIDRFSGSFLFGGNLNANTLTTNGLPPGSSFAEGSGTSPQYYYPWNFASSCFARSQEVAGACAQSELTLNGHNLVRVESTAVEAIRPNTVSANTLTFGNNVNIYSAPTYYYASGTFYFGPDSTYPLLGANATGNTLVTNGAMAFAGTVQGRHFVSTASMFVSPAAGAGTGASASVLSSTQCKMSISLTQGSSPSGTATLMTIVYSTAPATFVPGVVFAPQNAAAASLSGANAPYVTGESVAGFALNAGTSAISGCSPCIWAFQTCA